MLAACTGDIGGDDPKVEGPRTDPSGFSCDPEAAALTASPIKRLAKSYVENAVRELLSPMDDASSEALLEDIASRLELIPEDVAPDASNPYTTSDQNVSEEHVQMMFGLAVGLASKLADTSLPYGDQLMAVCGAGSTRSSLADDACLTTFITSYGRRAFRRPLTQAEIDDFKSFYQQASAAGVDPLSMLVGRLVGHPSFYYRFDSEGEIAEGTEGIDAVYALTKWELASKITFLFWAGPPTDALLDRIEATDITKDEELTAFVDEVLADPKAERGLLRFYRELLDLEDIAKRPGTEGNTVAGQAMLAAAGVQALPSTYQEDMIQEVLDLTKHYTLTTEGTLDDILTSQYSFAKTPELATIYGVSTWDGSAENLVSLPAGERSGLLTRAAFVSSSAEYTRPIIKGEVIRTRVLCQPVAPPPPGLDIQPLTHPADKSTRQAVEEATADAQCQQCHARLNGLGFASENYDPTGRFRSVELRFAEDTPDVVAELSIDTRTTPSLSSDDTTEVANAVDLSSYIAETGAADVCMVASYFEFVNGRDADPVTDGCDVLDMKDRLAAGESIKSVLKTSVLQESFRQRLIK